MLQMQRRRSHQLGSECRRSGRPSAGFTIIEILVVVAIISMLAAAGLIQLSRARMSAREQLALSNLRTISKGLGFYLTVNNTYPPNLQSLGPPQSVPPYVEPLLAQPPHRKQDYTFTYVQVNPGAFTLEGAPSPYGVSGNRRYLANQAGTIFYTDANRAVDPATDPTLP